MSMLFDTAPTDGDGKKKRSKRPEAAVSEEPVFSHTPFVHRVVSPKILRTNDDAYDCGDGACGARAHDVLLEEAGCWYIACAFCGTAQWVEAIADIVEPPAQEDDVFRFGPGRFPGMTVEEVAAVDDGLAYIAWMATSRKADRAARDACKTYLDRAAAAR